LYINLYYYRYYITYIYFLLFQTFDFQMENNHILFFYRIVKGQMTYNYSFTVAQLISFDNHVLNFAKEVI
jgi:DNA mismatch repair ATPase MutS